MSQGGVIKEAARQRMCRSRAEDTVATHSDSDHYISAKQHAHANTATTTTTTTTRSGAEVEVTHRTTPGRTNSSDGHRGGSGSTTRSVLPKERVPAAGSRQLQLGVSLRRFAYVTSCFPLCTLSACFLYSVAFSYSIVNTTICKVFNILPSLSAVTGVYPQCQLWRMAVALYFGPQIFLASMLPSYFKQKRLIKVGGFSCWAYPKIVMLSAVSHILECLSLIGVAFISSKESFRMHVLLFCSFTTFYLAHLVSTCWIVTQFEPTTPEQDTSRRYKLRLAVASGVCAFVMTIFFYLHRTRCLVMAFSVFALAEYVFGLSNILFHLTIIYDLPEVRIDIAFGGLRPLSSTSSASPPSLSSSTSTAAAATTTTTTTGGAASFTMATIASTERSHQSGYRMT